MFLYLAVLRMTSLRFAMSNLTCLRSAMFGYFFTLHDKTILYLTKLRHTQLNFAVLYSDVSILRQSLLRHTLPHCTVLLITSFGFSLGYALPDWTLLVIARQDSTLPYWDVSIPYSTRLGSTRPFFVDFAPLRRIGMFLR